jgi:sporulation protein YlmC with PRC-barrel domain
MLKTAKLFSTENITGCSVTNTAGEDLGKIEDLVVDAAQGCISLAVLSFGGGFLGLGERFFPIPWRALQPSAEANTFILDLDPEVLKTAPSFDKPDKNRWAMVDYEYLVRVYRYYDYPPYWQPQEEAQAGPASPGPRSSRAGPPSEAEAERPALDVEKQEQAYEQRIGSRAYRSEK